MSSTLFIIDAVLFVALLKVAKGLVEHLKSNSNEKKLLLPPGPVPKPFIGNLLDVPTGHSWLGWSKLAQEHGAFFHSFFKRSAADELVSPQCAMPNANDVQARSPASRSLA